MSQREQGSRSIEYYDKVTLHHPFVYGINGGNRRKETVISTLRLGYSYLWQVGVNVDDINKKCKVCGEVQGHNLQHYIMVCPYIEEYRNKDLNDIHDQARYLIAKVPEILKKYAGFASAK